MSRDLSFWKTEKEIDMKNEAIYTALSDRVVLPHISEIPTDKILEEFIFMFRDWTNQNNSYFEKDDEAFELMLTSQFVRVDCHGLTERNMNKIIDIMLEYDCPLYDSAINVRFNGSE